MVLFFDPVAVVVAAVMQLVTDLTRPIDR